MNESGAGGADDRIKTLGLDDYEVWLTHSPGVGFIVHAKVLGVEDVGSPQASPADVLEGLDHTLGLVCVQRSELSRLMILHGARRILRDLTKFLREKGEKEVL